MQNVESMSRVAVLRAGPLQALIQDTGAAKTPQINTAHGLQVSQGQLRSQAKESKLCKPRERKTNSEPPPFGSKFKDSTAWPMPVPIGQVDFRQSHVNNWKLPV